MHNFANNSSRLAIGKAGKINGRFGMAGPSQHASIHANKRKNVTGTAKIIWGGIRVNQLFNCICSVWGQKYRWLSVFYDQQKL